MNEGDRVHLVRMLRICEKVIAQHGLNHPLGVSAKRSHSALLFMLAEYYAAITAPIRKD
jgi:hypothetical protein